MRNQPKKTADEADTDFCDLVSTPATTDNEVAVPRVEEAQEAPAVPVMEEVVPLEVVPDGQGLENVIGEDPAPSNSARISNRVLVTEEPSAAIEDHKDIDGMIAIDNAQGVGADNVEVRPLPR